MSAADETQTKLLELAGRMADCRCGNIDLTETDQQMLREAAAESVRLRTFVLELTLADGDEIRAFHNRGLTLSEKW